MKNSGVTFCSMKWCWECWLLQSELFTYDCWLFHLDPRSVLGGTEKFQMSSEQEEAEGPHSESLLASIRQQNRLRKLYRSCTRGGCMIKSGINLFPLLLHKVSLDSELWLVKTDVSFQDTIQRNFWWHKWLATSAFSFNPLWQWAKTEHGNKHWDDNKSRTRTM